MKLILSIQLILAILLRYYSPKKPNHYFGYQLGSAKKSVEHWKLANKLAANYMIILYSALIIMSIIFDRFKYENGILVISILIVGLVIIYFQIEKKLKLMIN